MKDTPVRNAYGSWTPEWEDVGGGSRFPDVVGVAPDMHGDTSVYPTPVYSLDDHSVQIGWLGAHGYYPFHTARVPRVPHRGQEG